MSLILSVNQHGPMQKTIIQTLNSLICIRSANNISRLIQRRRRESSQEKLLVLSSRRMAVISRARSSDSTEEPGGMSSNKIFEGKQWEILRGWNVPWDWKIVLLVMMPYLMSIFLTGIVKSAALEEVLSTSHSENAQPLLQSTDEAAIRLLVDQLLKSLVKLSVLYALVSPYRPLPEDILTYRLDHPFNLQKGWFLWGVGGLVVASTSLFLFKLFISGSSASQMQNEIDALLHELPIIGASDISNVALISVMGMIAPVCEETVYRGFLMASLTKWLPFNASLVLSSVAFTMAHHSPGKSLEIFVFGIVLGLVYAQTRNLLAPITMHAFWNLGVIFTLIYSLQSQGHN